MKTANPPRYRLDNPLLKIAADVRDEARGRLGPGFPPGLTDVNPLRDRRWFNDAPSILLPAYERFGPVFTLRVFHTVSVWMIGPEASHFVLVSGAENFHWRESMYRELIPFLGDGLVTTDDEYHARSRRLMLPVFHTDHLATATRVMTGEADAATAWLAQADVVDVYAWARQIGMRVAMRALLGFDPDALDAAQTAAEFESGLSFYGRDLVLWLLRGPGTPYRAMRTSRARLAGLVHHEITARRAHGRGGEDILSSLMAAEDDDGWRFSDRQLLDHTLTLLFAGHDTTTSTVAFLFYELARNPDALECVVAELDRELGDEPADERHLFSGLPMLERALDETLRLYPPVPIGMRRSVQPLECAGQRVPADVMVQYSPWITHRLPNIFDDPLAFRPERMTPEAKAQLPKGAYIPFGGGRRICIGKRFGYLEAKVIASRLLQRFTPKLVSDEPVAVKWAATLSPVGGIPMRLRAR